MIPFPPPSPSHVLLRTASALPAISVRLEKPCSLPRCYSISALPRFLRSRSRPSAASRSLCVPRESARRALPSSFLPIAYCPPAAPAMAPNPSPGLGDRFPYHDRCAFRGSQRVERFLHLFCQLHTARQPLRRWRRILHLA